VAMEKSESKIQTSPEKIILLNEEIHDVINKPPSNSIRFGNFIILTVLLFIGFCSWLIKYPDLLKAKVLITTNPAPYNIVSKKSGNIFLLKSNGEKIKRGEIIAFITSNSKIQSVLELEFLVQSNIDLSSHSNNWELGELHVFFGNVVAAETALKNFINNQSFELRLSQLKKQNNNYKELKKTLIFQNEISKKEIQLALERFKTDSLLYYNKVLTPLEYNLSKSNWLQNLKNAKNSETAVLSNQITINEIEQQIQSISIEKNEKERYLKQELYNSKEKLKGEIVSWKEQNLFISPCDGDLSYSNFLENNMHIDNSKILFIVSPNNSNYLARGSLPVFGSGKVRVGQKVNIKVDNYPFEQFGMIEGEITSISDIPIDGNYNLEIRLIRIPEMLTSNNIELKRNLTGQTEIITDDLRLIDRFFNSIKVALRKN
jgi:hypothetical protein